MGIEDDPKHRCCCGCCHVKVGAITIAVLEAIVVIFQLAAVVYALVNPNSQYGFNAKIAHYDPQAVNIAVLCLVLIHAVGLVSCFVGLAKEKAVYLIPHIVIIILGLVMYVILSVVIMAVFGPKSNLPAYHWAGSVAGMVIIVLFWTWFTYVFYACYRYFKEKTYNHTATVTPQVYPGYGSANKGIE